MMDADCCPACGIDERGRLVAEVLMGRRRSDDPAVDAVLGELREEDGGPVVDEHVVPVPIVDVVRMEDELTAAANAEGLAGSTIGEVLRIRGLWLHGLAHLYA